MAKNCYLNSEKNNLYVYMYIYMYTFTPNASGRGALNAVEGIALVGWREWGGKGRQLASFGLNHRLNARQC